MTAPQASCALDDRFALEERLGSSAIADVFAARDRWSTRRVVIKRAKLPRHPSIIREHTLLVRLGAALGDVVPAIVADGVREPFPWFATAFVEGGNLRDLKHRLWPDAADGTSVGPPPLCPPAQRLDVVLDVALRFAVALARLHASGVVHADLRPENVLLSAHEQVVLIDFEGASSSFPELETGAMAVRRRVTPGFSAPEALLDMPLDCRADLYSWACIVRELLLGQPVFSGATNRALARLHIEARPKPLAELAPEVPAWLDAVLLGLLEKEPRRRRTPACWLVWKLARETRRLDVWRALDGHRPPANRPGFVGRHAEIRRLDERLDAAARGAGGAVVVRGAAGAGKSAFLFECAQRARTLGFRVLRDVDVALPGEGARAARDEPRLVRLLLEPWLAQRSAGASGDNGVRLPSDLLPYVPESIARAAHRASTLDAVPPAAPVPPDATDPECLPADALQRRAFRALAGMAQQVAAVQPVLVLLDDVLSEEEFSLAFLASGEARALGQSRLLVLASIGSTGLSGPFDASGGQGLELVELAGLDRSSTAQLVNEMVGTEGEGAAFALFLHEHCDGNPQRASEVVRWAIERGRIRFEPGGGWTFPGADALDELQLATRDDALEARLAPLDEQSLRVAGLAAVIGSRFSVGDLVELASELAPALEGVLRRLVALAVVAPLGDGYVFARETLRQACERRLSPAELQALHARRAELLAQTTPRDVHSCRRIAQHWLSAGRAERAVPWLLEAAEQLEVTLQPFGAISCLRMALDRLRAAEPPTPFAGGVLELGERLLQLYTRTGQHELLRTLATQMAEGHCRDWRAQCRALMLLARSLRITSDYFAAGRALDRAERCWRRYRRRGGDEPLWLELQDERIWLLYMSRDMHAIGPALQRMAPVVRRYGTAPQRASFYMLSANDLVLRNRYQFSPTAVTQERYALSLLQGSDVLPQIAMLEFDLAFQLMLGNLAHCSEAAEHLGRAHSLAERLGDPVLAVRATTYLAITERRLGHIAACHDAARRALEGAQLMGTRGYAGAAHACLGWVAWRRDDVGAALGCFAEARRSWWYRRDGGVRSRQEFPFQWLAELPLLCIHASRDDFVPARSTLEELLAETQQQLPAGLHDLLSSLQHDWPRLDAREIDRRISELTLRAAERGYI